MYHCLIIAGDGGHLKQAVVFLEKSNLSDLAFEVMSCSDGVNIDYTITSYMDKHRGFSFRKFFSHVFSVFKNVDVLRRADCVISFGPDISILPSILARCVGVTVIHIETRSRFYSKSRTGLLMYRIANLFLIQNKSLSKLYPRSIYVGRL